MKSGNNWQFSKSNDPNSVECMDFQTRMSKAWSSLQCLCRSMYDQCFKPHYKRVPDIPVYYFRSCDRQLSKVGAGRCSACSESFPICLMWIEKNTEIKIYGLLLHPSVLLWKSGNYAKLAAPSEERLISSCSYCTSGWICSEGAFEAMADEFNDKDSWKFKNSCNLKQFWGTH